MVEMKKALLAALTCIGLISGIEAKAEVFRTDSERPHKYSERQEFKKTGTITSKRVSASFSIRADIESSEHEIPVVSVSLDGEEVGIMENPAVRGEVYAVMQIEELDRSNPYPEVLFSSFTGGAHCCGETKVLTSDPSGEIWHEVHLGSFDGGPKQATDPLENGHYVIVSRDNRFHYQFDCYACGLAPTRIQKLKGKNIVDIGNRPEYRQIYRKHLQVIEQRFSAKEEVISNGFLAGYVAIKSRVGELSDGWNQMLLHYNRESDWGLRECSAGYDQKGNCKKEEVVYKSFPDALRAFLQRTAYITNE
ncbi:MAG: hypothetical protein AB8B16_04150 [Prochlorococcus sp.]